jgi:hypothetical protein
MFNSASTQWALAVSSRPCTGQTPFFAASGFFNCPSPAATDTQSQTGLAIMLASHPYPSRRDEHLVRIVARSRRWMQQVIAGEVVSLKALAANEGLDPAEISRLLPLACLSPDIVEAILAGYQPVNVTVERLKRLPDLPFEWSKQRQLLGCRLSVSLNSPRAPQ